MNESYQIRRFPIDGQGNPEYYVAKAPKAEIRHFIPINGAEYRPDVGGYAQVVFFDKGELNNTGFLMVRLFGYGAKPEAHYSEMNDPVYEEDALEFFFSPTGDGRYFNFELNSDGVLLLGYRDIYDSATKQRILVNGNGYKELFHIDTFNDDTGWGVSFRIPVGWIRCREVFQDWSIENYRLKMTGNFQRIKQCSGKDGHYVTWSKLPDDTKSFHHPEYFGKLFVGPAS